MKEIERKKTCYIVIKRNQEYNDEYYYFSDGGRPNNAFLDKGKAGELCFELNKKELQGLNLMEWQEDEFEIDEGFINLFPSFEKFLGKSSYDLDYEDLILPRELTNEQVEYIMDLTGLKFYEVFETELSEEQGK